MSRWIKITVAGLAIVAASVGLASTVQAEEPDFAEVALSLWCC